MMCGGFVPHHSGAIKLGKLLNYNSDSSAISVISRTCDDPTRRACVCAAADASGGPIGVTIVDLKVNQSCRGESHATRVLHQHSRSR